MKKSKLLMLLPAFLLVGCAKSLTPEEAQTVAKAINEKRAAEPITEFKMETTYSVEVPGEDKEEGTALYEFSEPQYYFHIISDGEESWAYKSGDKYIAATKEGDTKQYYEYGEEAKEQFEELIARNKQNAQEAFDQFAVVDFAALKEEYAKTIDADFKYSSKGDGQLTVELEWSGEAQGAKGSIEMKGVWEDYKPAEFSLNGESSYAGQSTKESMSAKFSYSVSPSYPDLSTFEKVVA